MNKLGLKNTIYFLCCLLLQGLMACSKKEYSQEEIYDTMASGVVLIRTSYINVLTIKPEGSSNQEFYFNNEDLNFLTEEQFRENPKQNPNLSYGTGFIISDKGLVVTNGHVVNPIENNVDDIFHIFRERYRKEYEYWTNRLLDSSKRLADLLEMRANVNGRMTSAGLKYLDDQIAEWKAYYEDNKEWVEYFDKKVNCKEYAVKPLVVKLEIAYNGDNIENPNSWYQCESMKKDNDLDLAVVKLHKFQFWPEDYSVLIPNYLDNSPHGLWRHRVVNESFREEFMDSIPLIPEDKYIFKIPNEFTSTKETKLFMIGFNQGPSLAITNSGIKAQITQGTISQNTDDVKLMYSIPALPGSSGSPVLNQYGELMAINFAGISTTQSFNYGIKVQNLKNLIENTPYLEKYFKQE